MSVLLPLLSLISIHEVGDEIQTAMYYICVMDKDYASTKPNQGKSLYVITSMYYRVDCTLHHLVLFTYYLLFIYMRVSWLGRGVCDPGDRGVNPRHGHNL